MLGSLWITDMFLHSELHEDTLNEDTDTLTLPGTSFDPLLSSMVHPAGGNTGSD